MKKKVIILCVIFAIISLSLTLVGCSADSKTVITKYEPGDYFVTNIKDSTRLLKVSVALEITTDKQMEFLDENLYVIRDAIIFSLREYTEDELRSVDIQNTINKELVAKLTNQLGVDYIQKVYFTDFVIQ